KSSDRTAVQKKRKACNIPLPSTRSDPCQQPKLRHFPRCRPTHKPCSYGRWIAVELTHYSAANGRPARAFGPGSHESPSCAGLTAHERRDSVAANGEE